MTDINRYLEELRRVQGHLMQCHDNIRNETTRREIRDLIAKLDETETQLVQSAHYPIVPSPAHTSAYRDDNTVEGFINLTIDQVRGRLSSTGTKNHTQREVFEEAKREIAGVVPFQYQVKVAEGIARRLAG